MYIENRIEKQTKQMILTEIKTSVENREQRVQDTRDVL